MSIETQPARNLTSPDVEPGEIESFLRTRGWRRVDYRPTVSAVWENAPLDASLMVPYNRRYRDFVPRLQDALNTISLVYDIEQDALPFRIASAVNDIVLLRADQIRAGDSIPLGEAQVLLDGMSRLMLVAACSAIRPRPSNPGKRPTLATDFVANDLRLGHTIRGSFVLPIFVHLDEADDGDHNVPSAMNGKAPFNAEKTGPANRPVAFSRVVVETLASGLAATRELLDPQGTMSLDDAVERGASAEMVESVGAMGRQKGVRSLDLSFVFSESLPRSPGTPDRVELPRPGREQVERVVRSLRQRPTESHIDIVGHVTRLERAEDDDGGVVLIDGNVGRVRRRVRLELSGDAYRLAIRAHEQRRPVVATGELTLLGRSWHLTGDPQIHFSS
ncbi:putative Uncharacterised protein [Frankia canadensis]|uniref:Uncharacterized protein n=1 Tax=Frankia canadensis TaxID=1836972 RepID=A0A2I2KP94_9ACTN|nr:putative Uncharacterised protein [Frankia canadensis]SOU54783.1 putative Uncharacterised protein [Frankia canadensis]